MFPDDVVVADDDGAVLIPAALLEAVVAEAPEQERLEGWIMGEVANGAALPGLYPPNAETKARYEADEEDETLGFDVRRQRRLRHRADAVPPGRPDRLDASIDRMTDFFLEGRRRRPHGAGAAGRGAQADADESVAHREPA